MELCARRADCMCFQLYTKSYELFKKYTSVPSPNATQGRLTLWIAYRIAQTYYDSGKFDMAIRFVVRRDRRSSTTSLIIS